jgi:hypothetical protein
MAIADLIKLKFKKPILSSEEQGKEAKKIQLETLIESAYSRLESIEILNANGKVEDSFYIIRLLALDLVNLPLIYYGKPHSVIGKDWFEEITSLKEERLLSIYQKHKELFGLSTSDLEKKEEVLEEMESKLNSLLSELEKFFSIIKRTELKTALSEQKFAWKVQGGILALLVITILGTILYRRVRYPDLAKTDVKVYFLTKEEPGVKEENSVATKILLEKKGEWVDYTFELPKATDITEIRIDPTEQARVRFSVESLKFYDAKGQLLYTHEFVYGADLLPKDQLSYGYVNDLKMAGKATPGAAIEMESSGNDPVFHLKVPNIKATSKLQLKIRHIEAYKKFN